MTDTETRPLPTTLAELRQHYFPAQPESSVTQCLAALRRLDELVAATREHLTQHDERDHEVIAELVAAAINGDKLPPIAGRINLGDRPQLDWRLEQLHVARSLAGHRHTQAERDDPIHQQWKRDCDELTREWQIVMNAGDTEDRFAGLVAFAARH